MPPAGFASSAKPPSGWYLQLAEREEIVLLRTQGLGVREIARQLDRAASTISRELRRNAATRGGDLDYLAATAQWHADRSARQLAKLVVNPTLRDDVQEHLAGTVVAPDGAAIHRPAVTWRGRRYGRRPGPAVGHGVEPRTDLSSPAARLSGGPDDAHQP
jgi:hypothetical protein